MKQGVAAITICGCDGICAPPPPQVTLKLEGSQLPDSSQLQQFSIQCEEEDKFLLIYTLIKLQLVKGKTLIFVGAVDRCYRLKLFLEQFGIPACVLNSELPIQSRSDSRAQHPSPVTFLGKITGCHLLFYGIWPNCNIYRLNKRGPRTDP